MMLTAQDFIQIAMVNPINAEIVARLPLLELKQCMLTAGCLFQAVWNQQAGFSVGWGVNDYDIFYFDEDLSWEAENEVIGRVRSLFSDLDVSFDIKNQARVHVWYAERFGQAYPQLASVKDGVDRYLVAGTCVGLEVATGEVYAPYGLADIEDGVLRINPLNRQPDMFLKKAKSYQDRWSQLRVVDD